MEPVEMQTSTSSARSEATPQASPPPQKGPSYWRWYVAAALVAAAVTGGAIVATSDELPVGAPPATTSTTVAGAIPAASADTSTIEAPIAAPVATPTPLLLDAAAVGQKVIPSVVTVQITGASFDGEETLVGSGSGVIYDDAGHIITNEHVVAAGTSYEVVLSDGRIYPAEVVGTDPTTDLAVLAITAENPDAIKIGETDTLTVGDPAVAVGSPLGLDGGPSLTVGVLSAFGREVQTDVTTRLYGMLQTDAPITSGSSGGALVNASGELIGITTAVGVSEVGIEGIGFATPIEIVTRVANEIIATGSATNPYLGIYVDPALEDTIDGGSIPIGIGVATIEVGMAADNAGLQEGDVIAAINGTQIKTFNELVASLRRYGAGTTIDVTLADGSTVDVTLGQRPGGQ